jgi:hypothetical protein
MGEHFCHKILVVTFRGKEHLGSRGIKQQRLKAKGCKTEVFQTALTAIEVESIRG